MKKGLQKREAVREREKTFPNCQMSMQAGDVSRSFPRGRGARTLENLGGRPHLDNTICAGCESRLSRRRLPGKFHFRARRCRDNCGSRVIGEADVDTLSPTTVSIRDCQSSLEYLRL